MQPGELLVARLSKGGEVVRFVRAEAGKVTIAIGRNKQARVPEARVALATGVVASDDQAADAFRAETDQLAGEIDLAEVWDVLVDDPQPLSFDDLAALYWGTGPSAQQRAALAIHLHGATEYFDAVEGAFVPRSRGFVEETNARRRREAENSEQAQALVDSLARGEHPSDPTSHQQLLLGLLTEFAVHGDDLPRAAAAKTLVAKLERGSSDAQRSAFELLTRAGVFEPDEPLELVRAGVPTEFPSRVISEAERLDGASVASEEHRIDITTTPTITIDDEETKDRDDALSVESTEGGVRVGVHIADAGALIPMGSAMDREADSRMASLYLPERTIPMLPVEIVRTAGSLDPGRPRPALSLWATVAPDGAVTEWEVAQTRVLSAAALSYADADAALEDPSHRWHGLLALLGEAASALRQRRAAAGAVLVDRAELDVHVRGADISVAVRNATAATELVGELMVLCNSLLAEYCRRESLPAAYRSQASPEGPSAALDERLPPALRRYVLMRTLRPAQVTTVAAPHASLGVAAYLQATSPLRRYPDLVMQRQISQFLNTGDAVYSTEEMASVAQRSEVQIRELAGLEEQRKRYWFLKFLQQQRLSGDDEAAPPTFQAVVLEPDARRPALLELEEYPFRLRAKLPPTVAAGGTVTLRLHGVDLWRRQGQWTVNP